MSEEKNRRIEKNLLKEIEKNETQIDRRHERRATKLREAEEKTAKRKDSK